MKRKTSIVVGIIFIVIIFILGLLFLGGGTVGLRPTTQGCAGWRIDSEKAESIFPKGELGFSFLNLYYKVGKSKDEWATRGNKDYCLGKDVWMGE